MKRWASLVVALYGLALVALTWPLAAAAWPHVGLAEIASVFRGWPYWALVGLLMLCQAALLFVPVKVASRRPVARRALLLPLGVAGFLVGVLVLTALFSVYVSFVGDDAKKPVAWTFLGCALAAWLAWTIIFYRLARAPAGNDVITRQCRLLLRGSILELLVAVPTHIIVRSRDYCCAGAATFLGLVFGVAVMLMAFGPGVFFLFVARWKRLHPEPTADHRAGSA